MRTQFIKELEKRAESDERIFLICGDLGFSVLENFRSKFPSRFLNVGIAEQNMAGIAAGLALEGYKVFIYSIGNFPSLRAVEQIRYDICYHELDVTIVSVGAGFAYGPLGCSHHATEDLAIMRALPNMIVYNPADPIEVLFSLKEIFNNKKASYLRLGKAGEPNLHLKTSLQNTVVQVSNGSKALVLTCGSIGEEIHQRIKNEKLDVAHFSIFKICESIVDELKPIILSHTLVVTIEENQLNGGFGSFILELMNNMEISNIPVKRFGITNHFIGYAGTQNFLRSSIVNNSIELLKSL